MKIEKYLDILLLDHDCVIIPSLGGFVTHYEPAYRNEETHLYYPPTRTLSFNSQLKLNDGLLVQTYMQAYDTNFPEANRMVEHDAEAIWKTLREEGSFTFESFGKLDLNDGTLVFTPKDESGVVAPDLYGLDAFMSEAYKAPTEVMYQEKNEETELINLVQPSENIKEDCNETTQHYILKINKTILHTAVAVVAALIFYLMLTIPVSVTGSLDNKGNILSATNGIFYHFPITQAEPAKKDIADLKINANDTIAYHQEMAIQENETTQKASEKTENIKEPYYTIVLASSVKQNHAEDFIKRLSSKGCNEASLYDNGNMLRIIYSKYNTESDAYLALHTLRENKEFKEAWIMQIHP